MPEAFAVPDKTADTVAQLIIEEIYPRHGCALQIVSDNGAENVNRSVKETLARLKIDHVLTSVYHPQMWDLFLNQALAASRQYIETSEKVCR